jgi:hypothetical protein
MTLYDWIVLFKFLEVDDDVNISLQSIYKFLKSKNSVVLPKRFMGGSVGYPGRKALYKVALDAHDENATNEG